MDEPLAALDDARRMEILSYIEKLRDVFAIPIVFVSHRLSEVERLASDIAVLDHGRVVETRSLQ
jgi:molybdate transport system ATP-binding protein